VKPTAYLLNLCRRPVVDEAALVEALQQRRIAGAALDVYEHEPRLGSSTEAAREAMGWLVAESVRAALAGKTPPNLVEGT